MIYVDDMRVYAKVGKLSARWSHLFSDTSSKELIEFALKLGLKVHWIQDAPKGFIHFDVTDNKRTEAIVLGAIACSWRDTPEFFDRVNGIFKYKKEVTNQDTIL